MSAFETYIFIHCILIDSALIGLITALVVIGIGNLLERKRK